MAMIKNITKVLFASLTFLATSWPVNAESLYSFYADSVCLQSNSADSLLSKALAESVLNEQALRAQVVELKRERDKLTARCAELSELAESRRVQIQSLDSLVALNDQRIEYADRLIGQLTDNCLFLKYDERLVNQVKTTFYTKVSEPYRAKLAKFYDLLCKYGDYYCEITLILKEAQSECFNNPFSNEKLALSYISKLKSSRYYLEVYKQNIKIPYLNHLINKAIERLNEVTYKTKAVNLTEADLMKDYK